MRSLVPLLLLAAILLPGCSKPVHDSEVGNYSQVSKEDAAMNAAIAKAQATSGEFVRAFRARRPGTRDFYVKKPYPVPGGGAEHMWIEVTQENDGTLQGTVGNEAEETKAVKSGDVVTLKLSEISDWKYTDGHKLVGGYTIRYFVDKMSPQERAAFLKENDFEL